MMRAATSIALLLLGLGQSTPEPPPFLKRTPQRVAVAARLEAPAKRGEPATLVIEATPQRGIHVYAPGNPSYIPVTVHVDGPKSVRPGTPVFPAAEPYVFGELKEIVQVYSKPFTIRWPVTLPHRAPQQEPLVISGHVRYQACNDRICFPPANVPFAAAAAPPTDRAAKPRSK